MWPFDSTPSDQEIAAARTQIEAHRQNGLSFQEGTWTPAHQIALHQLVKEDQVKQGVAPAPAAAGGAPSTPLQDEMQRRNYKDPALSNPVQQRQQAQRDQAAAAIRGK